MQDYVTEVMLIAHKYNHSFGILKIFYTKCLTLTCNIYNIYVIGGVAACKVEATSVDIFAIAVSFFVILHRVRFTI